MPDVLEEEPQPTEQEEEGEPEFGQDAEARQRPSLRDIRDAYRQMRGGQGAKQEAQVAGRAGRAAGRGAQATGRAAQAAGRAAAQAAQAAARAAAQLTARAAAAILSNPYVLAAIAIIAAVVLVIVILVFIVYSLTSPQGGSPANPPNPTVQTDMALTAKFRSLVGDPFNTDIAKQGAEFLKKQLTASQQTLATKTDQDSQKLKQKLDQAIGKLDEIIAETAKETPNDDQIKKLIDQFFKIYDSIPGIQKGVTIAEKARYWAQDGPAEKPNSESQIDYLRKSVCYNPTACSGLVSTAMVKTGSDLNYDRGNVAAQWRYVQAHPEKYLLIPNPQLQSLAPGDILIRPVPGANTSGHTGIYIGNGQVAHASIGIYKGVDAERFKKAGKLPRITPFSNKRGLDGKYYWRYAGRIIQ